MAEVKTEQEPSIEEILESIRQIIAEEGKPEDEGKSASNPGAAALDLSSNMGGQQKQAQQTVQSGLDLGAQKPQQQGQLREGDQPQGGKIPDIKAPLGILPQQPAGNISQPTPAPVANVSPPAAAAPVVAAGLADAPLDLTDKVSQPVDIDLVPAEEEMPTLNDTLAMMESPMTDETSDLVSAATADAVTDQLSKLLMNNVAVEREDVVGRPGKVTLEDIARELMKPMLKTWLDQNLPPIIERAVQKEVEKLSRRATER